MSLVDAAGADGSSESGAEGQTVDSLNADFQASTTESQQAKAGDAPAEPKTVAPWYYDENKPGEGERPEWLKDKYKSAADQAKAYNELDKKLGTFKGAPEQYDLALPDMPDFKFEDGDPMLQEFLDLAKESNASQEFVTKTLQQFIKTQQFYAPDPANEMQKLGANAKTEIAQLSEWAGQRLSKEEHEVFKGMVTTAETFRIFQKLKGAITSQPEIAVINNRPTAKVSEREVMEQIADPRFNTDARFRAEVEEKAAKIWS